MPSITINYQYYFFVILLCGGIPLYLSAGDRHKNGLLQSIEIDSHAHIINPPFNQNPFGNTNSLHEIPLHTLLGSDNCDWINDALRAYPKIK